MTTVVFVEKPNRVEIAYDSKVSMGHFQQELDGRGKVFTVGPVTFGVAGSLGFLNEVAEIHVPPIQPMTANETDRWVQRVLIPKIKQAAQAYDPQALLRGVHSRVLLAVNGRVYEIGGDYTMVRVKGGNYSIGSGSHYAYGALTAGKSAKEAVEIAAKHDMATGYTIHELIIKK